MLFKIFIVIIANAGLYQRKSLWYSRRYCFQHAMQIKGWLFFVIYFVDFCSTRAHWTTPSNALTVQGDGDYELAHDVVFDDFLRERIKKVHFCMNLSSKLLDMLYTS